MNRKKQEIEQNGRHNSHCAEFANKQRAIVRPEHPNEKTVEVVLISRSWRQFSELEKKGPYQDDSVSKKRKRLLLRRRNSANFSNALGPVTLRKCRFIINSKKFNLGRATSVGVYGFQPSITPPVKTLHIGTQLDIFVSLQRQGLRRQALQRLQQLAHEQAILNLREASHKLTLLTNSIVL